MAALLRSRWAQPEAKEQKTAQQEASPEEQSSVDKAVSSSTLSAAAIEFSPSPAPPADVAHQDEFAQTGADEDGLFDDLITTESMQTRPQDDLFGDDFTPAEHAVEEPVQVEPIATTQPAQARGEQHTRGRGRGRGKAAARGGQRTTRTETERATQAQPPENAPTGPKKELQPAVRGDRFATGGIKKPKLSEAELAEKMAQISIKNATLAAAHARAEADAASFEQREAQAKKDASKTSEEAKARAREERRDRQQMIGEREKNRMRKLKAIGGREWDAEKKEDDFARGGRHDKKGAFAGDQTDYTDGREYLLKEPRAHGVNKAARRAEAVVQPTNIPPRQDDFPALPSTYGLQLGSSAGKEVEKSSWADQVESSTAST